MKLKRVIHPEIILGRRGHPMMIKLYQEQLKSVLVDPVKGIRLSGIMSPVMHDRPLIEHVILCQKHRAFGKSYYIPEDFLLALSRIDKAIPLSVLPERFIGYFQFAEDVLSDEEGSVEGGYVYIGPANEIGCYKDGKAGDAKIMAISYMNKSKADGSVGSITRFTFLLENKRLADFDPSGLEDILYNHRPEFSEEETNERRFPVYRALVNAAIYLHSADPDLTKLQPVLELSHSKRAALRKEKPVENLCTVPVTLINWGYHDERKYSVNSAFVQTHMRWQPCGPQHSQVKLIWVKEHERHYKKEDTCLPPSPSEEAKTVPSSLS